MCSLLSVSGTRNEGWILAIREVTQQGKRFETWEEMKPTVAKASSYWNKHKHPFVWENGADIASSLPIFQLRTSIA